MKGGARKILEDLRRARVLVVHPRDEDGNALIDHLKRLGCEVRAVWPLPPVLPPDFDTFFVLVDDASVVQQLTAEIDNGKRALIAIVTYESPIALKAITDLNAHGVISKPVRPLGILTQFALARYRHGFEARLVGKVEKLEETLKGRRLIERATKVLAGMNGIEEETAYLLLRDQATSKRITLVSVAESVIAMSETMSGLGLKVSPKSKATPD